MTLFGMSCDNGLRRDIYTRRPYCDGVDALLPICHSQRKKASVFLGIMGEKQCYNPLRS